MNLLNMTMFDYIAIILLVIILIYSKTQFSKDVEANKFFLTMIYFLIAFSVFDLLNTYAIAYASALPSQVNYLFASGSLLSEVAVVLIFYKYVQRCTNSIVKHTVAYYVLSYFPAVFAAECIIANCFVFILFEFGKYGDVIYGPLFPFIYLIVVYYYGLIIYVLIRNRKTINKRQRNAILYLIAVSVVLMLLQMLVLTELSLQCLGFAIAALILMLSLETPDYQKLTSTLKSLEAAREQADKFAELKSLFVPDSKSGPPVMEYNFKKCIEDVYNKYKPHAHENKIALILDSDDSIPDSVIGSKLIVSTILTNFIENTIAHTPRGRITIRTRAENMTADSFDIIITVIDTNVRLSMVKFYLESGGIIIRSERTGDGNYELSLRVSHKIPTK